MRGFTISATSTELLRCMIRLRLIDGKEQALRFKLFVLHMEDVSIITPAYEIHKSLREK